MNQQIFLYIVCGTAGAFLFRMLHIPGGLMLGATVGGMLVKLLFPGDAEMPSSFFNAAQIAMGICVGAMLSKGMLAELRGHIPEMLVSTGILLGAGFLAALFVAKAMGMDIVSSILATSPGGLNAVIGLSDEPAALPKIMAFQMVRLYAILIFVPVLCWLMKFFLHR